jgi:hypothetical protein
MTTRRSAVRAISLIRWEDTNTVRPSPARERDEVFEVGDAFYIPPGHVPVKNEPGTGFLWFSPSEELRTAEAVMIKNMEAMQDGSTP